MKPDWDKLMEGEFYTGGICMGERYNNDLEGLLRSVLTLIILGGGIDNWHPLFDRYVLHPINYYLFF